MSMTIIHVFLLTPNQSLAGDKAVSTLRYCGKVESDLWRRNWPAFGFDWKEEGGRVRGERHFWLVCYDVDPTLIVSLFALEPWTLS